MKASKPLRILARSLAALGLHSAALVHGEDASMPTGGSNWGLGLAVMSESRPYRDFDRKTELIPFFTFENRRVRVFGPGVEFKLGKLGPVSFGLTASYGMDGYKASDSPYFDGMTKRKGSAWIGAKASLRGKLGHLSTEWSTDASSNSKGQKVKVTVERRFTIGEVGVTPRLTATGLDSKFVRYYYGVEAVEVRAGRGAYSAGATVNAELGLRLDYRPAPQHTVFADLGATALGREVKSSPLVDRSSIPEVRLGYLYRF